VEAYRKEFGCFDELETLDSQPPDFTQDGRSGEAERERLATLAASHVNRGVRYTDLAEWERPRYEHELHVAAEERDIAVEALQPVDDLPDVDGMPEDAEGETMELSFAAFTDDELDILSSHLGEIREFSPEKRKKVLVAHFRRLNMAGVRFEASAD
jgi:hypothetical protein